MLRRPPTTTLTATLFPYTTLVRSYPRRATMHNAHGRKSGIPGDDMNIVCIGGGPAGLYFGLLMKLHDPGSEVTIVERNRPYDTFGRSEEHTSEVQSLMRISYAVFCLKQKKTIISQRDIHHHP